MWRRDCRVLRRRPGRVNGIASGRTPESGTPQPVTASRTIVPAYRCRKRRSTVVRVRGWSSRARPTAPDPTRRPGRRRARNRRPNVRSVAVTTGPHERRRPFRHASERSTLEGESGRRRHRLRRRAGSGRSAGSRSDADRRDARASRGAPPRPRGSSPRPNGAASRVVAVRVRADPPRDAPPNRRGGTAQQSPSGCRRSRVPVCHRPSSETGAETSRRSVRDPPTPNRRLRRRSSATRDAAAHAGDDGRWDRCG